MSLSIHHTLLSRAGRASGDLDLRGGDSGGGRSDDLRDPSVSQLASIFHFMSITYESRLHVRVMAVGDVVGGVDGTAVALADGSKVPAVQITRLDAGEGRIAAVLYVGVRSQYMSHMQFVH
jgi:hypothetical protein